MINFKLKNIDFSLMFSFFAVFAVLFYSKNDNEILLALLVCIIHEMGHIIAMTLFNCNPEKIILYGGGIKIIPNCRILSYDKDILVNCAGSFVNLVCGILFLKIGVFEEFSHASIVIGIFNLLPFSNFDGAKIINLIFENKEKGKYLDLLGISEKILCFIITSLGIYYIIRFKFNISLLVTICYIIISEIFS